MANISRRVGKKTISASGWKDTNSGATYSVTVSEANAGGSSLNSLSYDEMKELQTQIEFVLDEH